jgi:GNAT superfamily N-acetyltransferase
MSAPAQVRRYRARERLADDSTLLIRALRQGDAPALTEGFRQLSPRSVHQRFFDSRRQLTDSEVRFYTELDFDRHVGLAGLIDAAEGPVPVATARYVRVEDDAPDSAEMAFVVLDAYQGKGIGRHMFRHLAGIARRRNIRRLVADVLPDNYPMLEVLRRSGYAVRQIRRGDVLHVEVLLDRPQTGATGR